MIQKNNLIMSYGNFNRSLLPHTPYHSGLQTGKSMARMKAIEAFKCYLEETHAHLNEEEQKTEVECFKKILSSKI